MKRSALTLAISRAQGAASVAILHVRGDLDRFTYMEFINQSRQVYNSGQRFLIIDMSELRTIGISGLFALYSIATIFHGEEPLSPEGGWNAVRAMASRLKELPQRLKLLKPRPQIAKELSRSGLPIYDDLPTALASF